MCQITDPNFTLMLAELEPGALSKFCNLLDSFPLKEGIL